MNGTIVGTHDDLCIEQSSQSSFDDISGWKDEIGEIISRHRADPTFARSFRKIPVAWVSELVSIVIENVELRRDFADIGAWYLKHHFDTSNNLVGLDPDDQSPLDQLPRSALRNSDQFVLWYLQKKSGCTIPLNQPISAMAYIAALVISSNGRTPSQNEIVDLICKISASSQFCFGSE